MSRLKLKRPLVWVDLETTGLDPRRDRIVEISVIREEPDGASEQKTRRVNPGMPIPPEATAIHGITDEDVRQEPGFDLLAKGFAKFLEGADLGGFGISRFDIPMLSAEFQRAGLEFSLEGRCVVDVQRIFHKNEPRDLSAACRFYLDRELDSAHTSAADAAAAREVLAAQLERYSDLPDEVSEIDGLFRDTSWIDAEGKLAWRSGEAAINFGKHRGRTLRELAGSEPDYLRWMMGRDFSTEVTKVIEAASRGEFPKSG
jgi:DNA polymerase-3 subunit epsilon